MTRDNIIEYLVFSRESELISDSDLAILVRYTFNADTEVPEHLHAIADTIDNRLEHYKLSEELAHEEEMRREAEAKAEQDAKLVSKREYERLKKQKQRLKAKCPHNIPIMSPNVPRDNKGQVGTIADVPLCPQGQAGTTLAHNAPTRTCERGIRNTGIINNKKSVSVNTESPNTGVSKGGESSGLVQEGWNDSFYNNALWTTWDDSMWLNYGCNTARLLSQALGSGAWESAVLQVGDRPIREEFVIFRAEIRAGEVPRNAAKCFWARLEKRLNVKSGITLTEAKAIGEANKVNKAA